MPVPQSTRSETNRLDASQRDAGASRVLGPLRARRPSRKAATSASVNRNRAIGRIIAVVMQRCRCKEATTVTVASAMPDVAKAVRSPWRRRSSSAAQCSSCGRIMA
ncbi:hypothetical protein ABI_44180 [Asticcacaulis biprosthecium C19]|uniref:Uncharacterized protein n=1 Tax=Asticcacaulis biprosthecium C19 TaxID=715226 RepID=F4QTC1_9CAUL|nr:hypothetical protein ABI_44180 [Asticcacaulis biprosthecium C19]